MPICDFGQHNGRGYRDESLAKENLKPIILIADTHSGSTVAICPPEVELAQMEGEEQTIYRANKIQLWMWQCWLDFCKQIPKGSTGCIVGDVVEGVNSKNGSVISTNRVDHINIAVDVLTPFCERCAETFTTFGTEWHEFVSGVDLVQVIKLLQGKGFKVHLPRQEVWLEVGDQLVHCAHHTSISRAPSSKGTPLARAIGDMLFEAPKRDGRYPNVVVRAHSHDPGYLWLEQGLSIGLPAWQHKTFFAWKKVPAVVSSIGGFMIDYVGGSWYVSPKLYRAKQSKAFKLQPLKKSSRH